MQVSVEALNPIERRMTVIVPFEKVDEAFDKRISEIAKTAKIKGFRPGKIPLEHVKQKFSDTARQEALSQVIQNTLYTALNQEKLQPVSVPTVQPKTVAAGQPLEYVATFEIMPQIQAIQFSLDALEKDVTQIQDSDIDNIIEKLREQHVQWHEVDRPAKEKDRVIINFSGSIEGKLFAGGQAKNYAIVIGSKTMIPGFEEGIIGAKNNETRTIDVCFPENYFAKDVAGKTAQFAIDIKQVFEPELPGVDENFLKIFGIEDGKLDTLKKTIKQNLNREVGRLIKSKLKNKVFDKLLSQNPMEVPKALIKQEAERIHHQLHPHHHDQNDHGHSDAEMAVFNEAATKNVKLGLLMSELIKQYQLVLTPEKVNEYIMNEASHYEDSQELIDYYQKNKKRRAEVEMLLIEELLIEKLLENVNVTDHMLSYADFMKDVTQ